MKNHIATLCLIVASMLIVSSCKQPTTPIKTILRGEVIDRPESTLVLWRNFEDFGIHGIEIPIVDGKFEYILETEHIELYELMLFDDNITKWSPMAFFSEGGVFTFTLYPEDRDDENKMEGGKFTNQLLELNKKTDEKYRALNLKIEQLGEDDVAIEDLRRSFRQETLAFDVLFIKENPTVVGYLVLLTKVSFAAQGNIFDDPNFDLYDISLYIELFETVFRPKFPNHPYTKKMEILLAPPSSMLDMPFIDFTTSDLNGNPVTLSEQISGKPAVLHLWASWCSPCIRKGKELIPVYEEFRDSGFVVIGVARERDISDAIVAVERAKFPWLNLVELRDAQEIWDKYGFGDFAGAEFLIDENGIIVAVNPSIEEIRNFLVNKFQ
jgi:thiol-disulfide isomerase/thioredoxin